MNLPSLIERFFPAKKAETFGSPIQAFRQWLSGESPRMTASNIETYLGRYADQAWVYSCISVIQSKGAGVPLKVYKKVGDQLEEQPNHPLKELLDSVNPMMNGYDLLEATHGFIELAGNEYWLLDKFIDGKPTEIYPLSPQNVTLILDKKLGVVGYEYRINGQLVAVFPPEVILHFKTWNPLDPFYGQPRLSAGRDSSDMISAADQYNKAFFKNGAAPGGFLTTDTAIDEDTAAQIRTSWKKAHQGANKAHSIALLQGGLKWQNNSSTQSEMMFPQLKSLSREDVLTCFRVPPIMVGVFDEANYANAREQRRIFWVDGMIPRLRKIESVINERLAKPYDATIVVMHDLSGVEEIAEDEGRRAQTNTSNVSAGIMTINEVRMKMKLPPVPWGDTWFAPFGLSPVSLSSEPDDQPTEDTPPAKKRELHKTKEDSISEPVIEEPPQNPEDIEKARRDATWGRYKDATERWERKWLPVMRSLFNSQEREVIRNLRDSDWQKSLNQNRLDQFKNIKASIDLIVFDKTNARKVFQRDARKLIEYTLSQAAEKEIRDYDLGIDFDLTDPNVKNWINSKAFNFANEINLTTEDALRRELSEAIRLGETLSEVEDRVAHVFDVARGSRTAMIARTEVISASNAGALESYKQSGLVKSVEWISSRDNKVREEHQIDGEQVDIGAKFSNGLKYPGDPEGEPGNVINCRCTIAPIVEKGPGE